MTFLIALSTWLWPELNSMNQQRRLSRMGDVLCVLYSYPLATFGILWLAYITDIIVLRNEWGFLLLIFVLMILFNQVNYFIVIEIQNDRYGSSSGSLASMLHWSVIFLIGPSALWLMILWSITYFIWNWRKTTSKSTHWSQLRNLGVDLSINTFAMLMTLSLYESLGGVYPIDGLTTRSVLLALVALIIQLGLTLGIWSGYIVYHLKIQSQISGEASAEPILKFFLLSFGFQFLAHPFAILAAGLYVEHGLFIYLFLITGLLFVAYLTRKLSWAVENSRQQSRLLEQLEQLGRAIINAPPDGSELPDLLKEYVPKMFPAVRLAIVEQKHHVLFIYPEDWNPNNESLWEYILSLKEAKGHTVTGRLPWAKDQSPNNAIIVAPVLKRDSGEPIGGIYVELRTLALQWNEKSIQNFFPAIQTLAAQISSTLSQAEIYHQTIQYQKISQELRLAGKIQSSFLPQKLPNIAGWQISVTLLPARETSGDFFDVIPLSDGKMGLLIADVMDKGVGPALYMAICRTLIRTYAVEYDADPEIVLFATNQRLLNDARASLFVTAFYGILDPTTGEFIYSNAGHNPPFLIDQQSSCNYSPLNRTGIAMGIERDSTWEQGTVKINPGDILLLYTDGIPDSQNTFGEFFDERFIEIASTNPDHTAYQLENLILEEMQSFVGNASQLDDITLMILKRDKLNDGT